MEINVPNTEQKQAFFKAYPGLKQIEKALKTIKGNNRSPIEISILRKLDPELSIKREKASLGELMENHWKDLMGNSHEFDFFYNPEIGTIFIAGFLVSTFLHDVDGKTLGTLSVGPYGILRGLGMSQYGANNFIKGLQEGANLLIVRGNSYELDMLEDALRK